jgi:hypothetical protein
MVKVRAEFKRAGKGPQLFNDHRVPTGETLPLDLLDESFRVLQTKYDYNDRTLASDLLWVSPEKVTDLAFWVRRGDVYEVIEKVKPLKRPEQDKLVHAMKNLIAGYTTGDCYKSMNPYARPYVREALELIAAIEGKSNYLDVKVG